MAAPRQLVLTATGVSLAVAGAATTVLFFFQPWRTCPYDDSPTACAMLHQDATVMGLAIVATLIGTVLLATGLVLRSERQ